MQCKEELDLYERLKKGDLPPVENFRNAGRFFIAARIARGMTQRQLAESLDVKESQVSRDERNEYHGISLEKAERLAEILNVELKLGKKLAVAQ
jgi:transcriptional regulator with XRE-family HTH domain